MRVRAIRCFVVAAAVFLGAGSLHAQSRKAVYITDPGTIHSPGDSTGVASFDTYSYGLGSQRSGWSDTSANPLWNSMSPGGSRVRSFAVRDPVTDSGLLDIPPGPTPIRYSAPFTQYVIDMTGESTAYTPTGAPSFGRGASMTTPIHSSGGGGAKSSGVSDSSPYNPTFNRTLPSDLVVISPAQAYLDAIGASSVLSTERTKPIVSLALSDGSRYSMSMRQGERYFRSGDYMRAYTEFQMASLVADRDPASAISMAHAIFAGSRESYSSAAYYVRQAVRYFPELPLAPLQPRSFFGQSTDYAKRMSSLEEYLRNKPNDADGQIVLAYFRWFEGDSATAKDAIFKAYASSGDSAVRADIEDFWAGMVASGKVSGVLQPPAATQPVGTYLLPRPIATSQPAKAPTK